MMTASRLTLIQTERAILDLKRHFEDTLTSSLRLHRVSAPMFVDAGSGLQDNLNGIERPVSFKVPAIGDTCFEIVHSLAKWKRLALARYGMPEGEGLYTDMNALRPDEPTITSAIHSVYVDQWDWERIMSPQQRNLEFLKATVETIYNAILATEHHICSRYDLKKFLPHKIHFIHSEDLLARFPGMTSKERENAICREHGAVFIIGIGGALSDGSAHDGRAPDYDDWTTETAPGRKGLNGDILVFNPILEQAFEVSSMGIRVSPEILAQQLKIRGCEERAQLLWHKMLMAGKMPQTIGGGIGQSRLSMLLLQKRHIGEVQVSVWPADEVARCEAEGIQIL
ncbi:MAG: aspartate--ammonia ligase [Candidatus Riflebacteria bacterium HGW-Riflebacteria-2]|nr:MAG: aspartate--ammonia ligase [Candidatus Riflebacteria bacterium HGW-Riflebacteria-2]